MTSPDFFDMPFLMCQFYLGKRCIKTATYAGTSINNNILIAVSLAPGGASAKHGKIAPQQMQEFIGGAIQAGTIL